MKKGTLFAALALTLVLCASAQADAPLVRQVDAQTVYVHVIACPAWPGHAEPIADRRVEVRDDNGVLLIWARTTATGDAIMQVPLSELVTVTLDTGQSITVHHGTGALYVAFWVGRCATEAANW